MRLIAVFLGLLAFALQPVHAASSPKLESPGTRNDSRRTSVACPPEMTKLQMLPEQKSPKK